MPATFVRSLVLAVGALSVTARAQDAPASRPADERQPVFARVIDLHGDVQHAPAGSTEWQPCKLDDEYPESTRVRTGLRSSIKLQLGQEEPYSVLVIESVGLTELSEIHKTRTTKRVRVGVGYGRVRAGVAEGGLISDFTVDSPVATLSKRGTWNFGLAYEPDTQRFEIFLLDYGLVDALNKITGGTRRLLPGQVVTEAMRRWGDEAQIRRNVAIPDILGQGDVEVAFNRIQNDGVGVTNPGGGAVVVINLSNSVNRAEFTRALERSIEVGGVVTPPLSPPPPGTPRLTRPEGFFGTGRGDELIPVLIDPDSALVKSGAARAGTYRFRRSAVEQWLGRDPRR